jgi:hypothetical protein
MGSKFKYDQIALIQKGSCGGIYVKVGIKFDSKVHCKKNPSGISYYIEGYEVRDWCYQEELRRSNFLNKLIIYLLKVNSRFTKKNDSK